MDRRVCVCDDGVGWKVQAGVHKELARRQAAQEELVREVMQGGGSVVCDDT